MNGRRQEMCFPVLLKSYLKQEEHVAHMSRRASVKGGDRSWLAEI